MAFAKVIDITKKGERICFEHSFSYTRSGLVYEVFYALLPHIAYRWAKPERETGEPVGVCS